jgi:hypothetical protein
VPANGLFRSLEVCTGVCPLVTSKGDRYRQRLRCQATTKAGVQCRSTAVSDIDGLCAVHGGRLNPVELGRKGGKARGKSKGKRGSFRAAVAGLLERDPDRYAAELLNSGAAGFKLASDLLEKEEAKVEAERSGPLIVDGQAVTTLRDVIAYAYRTGQAHHFGLPLTHEQLDELMATEGEGGAGERGTPVPSESPGAYSPVPLADEPLPIETDADVDLAGRAETLPPSTDLPAGLRSSETGNGR